MKGFASIGFKPEVKPLTFFQDDYGLEGGDGDDSSSSEDAGSLFEGTDGSEADAEL